MKKDDAMREQHNISENEKKKKDGWREKKETENKTFDQMKEH
jgi:hypothetical protein